MKVSIITTCYNRAKTIRDTIDSVREQSHEDIEYIIVDGASTDGSVEIIRSSISDGFTGMEVKFISEPDGGMYEAVNKGVRLATGDVIGLLHSDDVFCDKDVVRDIVDGFRQKDPVDFVYGDGVFVDSDNPERTVRVWKSGEYSLSKVRHGWLPLHPTCYVRREFMGPPAPYDEKYKIAADTDFLLRLLLREDIRVGYLRRDVVRMRMGGLSTDRKLRRRMWNEDIDIFRSRGFRYPRLTKIEKMLWKVPQFVRAKIT